MPGGSTTAVTTANRAEYVERVVAARLGEIDRQCEALRRGLLSACIPSQLLGLWTVDEFQRMVCGSPTIPSVPARPRCFCRAPADVARFVRRVESLKKQTKFSGSGPEDMFWTVRLLPPARASLSAAARLASPRRGVQVMSKFTDEERGLVLKFSCGRARLPVRLSVSWNSGDDERCPSVRIPTHGCASVSLLSAKLTGCPWLRTGGNVLVPTVPTEVLVGRGDGEAAALRSRQLHVHRHGLKRTSILTSLFARLALRLGARSLRRLAFKDALADSLRRPHLCIDALHLLVQLPNSITERVHCQ